MRRLSARPAILVAIAIAVAGWAARLESAGLPPLIMAAVSQVAPASDEPSAVKPPVAKVVSKIHTEHGQRRIDNYDWLRDKDNPEVLAHIRAENAYAEARLAQHRHLIDEIRKELHARAEGASESPDFIDGGYVYRRRIAQGARFPAVVRRLNQPGAPEEVVLDVERLAAGHAHYDLADYAVSPDGIRVAFAVDFTGNRLHRIFIRDIATGDMADTGIKDAASEVIFSADSQWLFYIKTEPDTVRSFQLWIHRIAATNTRDRLIFHERDPSFELSLSRTRSGRFILLESDGQTSTETRYLPADRPNDALKLMERRRPGVRYSVDHIGDHFYLRTNLNAPDFRIVRMPEAAPKVANWTAVVDEKPGRLIADFTLFETFIAIVEEHDAIQSVRVVRLSDMTEVAVPRPTEIGVMEADFAQGIANADPSATVLQVRFSGPTHPFAAYDFDPQTGRLTLRRQSRAARWFDASAYESKRIEAAAPDGTLIPATLIYRKDRLRPGGNPTLVTGYGAYGSSMQPGFQDSWVSLIDRGFVYALAHVRGGRDKGARWHDRGRLLRKHNSFTDFIAVTEALIAQGYADRKRVFAHGASAGGLLVAAVVNMRPELYAGIVAEVPFVDVLTTMRDPTLPLTTLEYREWGNPASRTHYDVMRSYSPYDNVTAKDYPPMFVTAALHDSQVGFHEPAKWVARLRAVKTDGNELLFVTDLEAGHAGQTGRFGATRENAQIIAWLVARAQPDDGGAGR